MDTKPNYVTESEPAAAPGDSGVRPVVLGRIKQALVTSRLTLGSQSTGGDPYDSRRERTPGSVWGNRGR